MMKEGHIVGTGPVTELVTADLIADVYGLDCDLITDPHSGRPIVVPVDQN